MDTGRGGWEEGEGGRGVVEREDEREEDESDGWEGIGEGVESLEVTEAGGGEVLIEERVTGASEVEAASKTEDPLEGEGLTGAGRATEKEEEEEEEEEEAEDEEEKKEEEEEAMREEDGKMLEDI